MRRSILLAVAASVAVLAAPQAPLDTARGGLQPVFRSGADLVRFDLRVTDASGRPIRDLRPEEIEIAEDGATQAILLFQHLDEPAGTYAEAALRSVSAEVSSNRGAPWGRLYILIFDQAHIAPGNEQIARGAAETFIKTRVRPSDRIAVVGIPGPGPDLGFTADRTRAIAELAKMHAGGEQTDTAAGGSLQQLGDLIAQYRAVEGRKTVLLFSEGFHQRNVSGELEHAAAAAAQSHAVFYAFDLNRRAGADVAEPLGSLAADTGGALVIDATSHLETALDRIADQARDYYIVGFTPSADARATRGEYRRVSLRVTRAGAHVNARTGYATPKSGQPLDRRRAIDAALA